MSIEKLELEIIEEFEMFDSWLEKYEYIGGAAPRTNIKVPQGDDLIFTANEAPSDKNIPFHHELAQSSNPPSYISFYCKKAPESGGETPLVDSTLVYRYLYTTGVREKKKNRLLKFGNFQQF